MAALTVTPSQLLWHRLRANNLAERLPAGDLATAAYAGLQDSAPRAALTALHARVDDVGADSWEHPALAQTWAPRGAVFVVPRDDLAVFARGILPRDPQLCRLLEDLGSRARELVRQSPAAAERHVRRGHIPAQLAHHLRDHPVARLACAIGGVQIRWDASRTRLLEGPALDGDPEAARLELVRRHLRSLGPSGPAQFMRWAAVGAGDAQVSFDAIRCELVEVEWPGGSGLLAAADAERLAAATPVSGVRLLAFGADPVLQPGHATFADPVHERDALPRWACSGLAIVDGEVAASWGRTAPRITFCALRHLGRADRDELGAHALAMPNPQPIREVVWRDRR